MTEWEVLTEMRQGNSPTTGVRPALDVVRNQGGTAFSYQSGNYLNDGAPPAIDEGARAKEKSKPKRMDRGHFGESVHELESGLLTKVYGLLAFSLLFSLVGGFIGYRLEPAWMLLAFPAAIGLIFAVHAAREAEPWNLVLLYAFTFTMGLALGPLIAYYVAAGYGAIVIQAAVATALVTAGLSIFALTIKADLAGWGAFLFTGLLALIGVSFVNLFIGGALLYMLTSCAGALIFSLYLIYDVNRIRYAPDTMGNAVLIAMDIYLDIVNLFLNLLRILVAIAGEGD